MTNEQFKEIRDMAWDWWCKNMLDWAVDTIKDFDNAPKWVKSGVDNSLEQDNLQKLLRLSQTRNFEVNYSKEITEFFKASSNNNEYGIIDSVCDMLITAINAGHTLGLDRDFKWCEKYCNYNLDITMPLYDKRTLILLCTFLRNVGYDPYKCLVETIKELNTRTGAWNEQEGKWCKYLGAYTEQEARDKLLEIERIEWFILKHEDDDFWYFGQDDGVDFFENKERAIRKVKKWYKADYENCKIAVCPYCKNDCGYGKYVECQNCGMKFQTIAD